MKRSLFAVATGLSCFVMSATTQAAGPCGCTPGAVVYSTLPATYSVSRPVQAQEVYPGTIAAPPAQVYYPPVSAGQVVYRPVLPLTRPPGEIQIGRGILGQPKAYVPSQPIRNFLRYLTP